MKNKLWASVLVLLMLGSLLSSCEAIGGIFKAGMWTGIIGVVFIILVVIFIIAKVFSKKN